MKKGILTMAIPQSSWLYPYIEYEVEYNDHIIIVDGYEYENSGYHKRGWIQEIEQ